MSTSSRSVTKTRAGGAPVRPARSPGLYAQQHPRPAKESEMTDTTNVTELQPAADRSRWIALVVLCVGMLMIVLDATIVNVALPSIQSDLGFSQSSLAWVVNAYLITFGGLLLLAGRL